MTQKPTLTRGNAGAWKVIFETAPNAGMKFTQQQYAELVELCRGYLGYLDMMPRLAALEEVHSRWNVGEATEDEYLEAIKALTATLPTPEGET